ncbi:unnamed protein product (mitochondrion) [Plasmodiophora brassicae]|uniref:Methionine synthase reductase n=1 Tax=Plasmodiophora brassicae TaxID=37360 RepID=A0A3P3Y7W4_PLABS|nr:unnamed protein product [Plasmodiophora brassicae]
MSILFGSQTGNAEDIARRIGSEVGGVAVMSMDDWMKSHSDDINQLSEERVIVIITSTTGNGEAPDNAHKFWRKLRRHKASLAGKLSYSVLGLGDSNYDQFCNCGKTIDARLDAIGAIRFVPSAFADEATGLEKTVEPYVRLVVEACRALLNNEGVAISPPAAQLAPHDTIVPPSTEPSPKSKAKLLLAKRRANAQPELVLSWADDSTDYLKEGSLWRWRVDETELLLRGYTPESPFWSEICHAEYLTAPSSKKTVLHCELSIPNEYRGLSYNPGDVLGIYCPNSPKAVDTVLEQLGLGDGSRVFKIESKQRSHLPSPCSIRDVLLYCCDLRSPLKKSFIKMLAAHCSVQDERDAILRLDDAERLLSLDALLRKFPSCRPPIVSLLDQLPSLKPRYYSISSSPICHPSSAHIAFTVLPDGLCSSWMHDLCLAAGLLGDVSTSLPPGCKVTSDRHPRVAVPAFLRRSQWFVLPDSLHRPIIMIGPGHGLWRGCDITIPDEPVDDVERSHCTSGESYLFFGCRHRELDFIYRKDLEQFVDDGTLSNLITAFSRDDPEDVVYVTHRLREHAKLMAEMIIDRDAVVYVCGDGAQMAKDVQNTFVVDVLAGHAGMDTDSAKRFLSVLMAEHRYVQDIWS